MSAQTPSYPLPADRDPHMRRLELLISRLLRVGVIASVTLIVVGTIVTFVSIRTIFDSSAVFDSTVGPGATFPHELGAGAAAPATP